MALRKQRKRDERSLADGGGTRKAKDVFAMMRMANRGKDGGAGHAKAKGKAKKGKTKGGSGADAGAGGGKGGGGGKVSNGAGGGGDGKGTGSLRMEPGESYHHFATRVNAVTSKKLDKVAEESKARMGAKRKRCVVAAVDSTALLLVC